MPSHLHLVASTGRPFPAGNVVPLSTSRREQPYPAPIEAGADFAPEATPWPLVDDPIVTSVRPIADIHRAIYGRNPVVTLTLRPERIDRSPGAWPFIFLASALFWSAVLVTVLS